MSIEKRKGRLGTTYRVVVYHHSKRVASTTFDTLREAKKYESKIKSELDSGVWADKSAAENLFFCDALDRYVETISKLKKGEAYRRELSQVKQIKRYQIALLPLASIKSADVALFRNQRSNDVGKNSVRLALALISHLFTVAIQEWHMDYLINPVSTVKKVSVSNTKRDRRLEGDEYRRLMRSAKAYSNSMRLIIPFAIETAMRQGEIASIKPCDVDLANRVVVLPDTKNNESRIVPLSRRAYHIIRIALRRGGLTVFSLNGDSIRSGWSRVCARCVHVDDVSVADPVLNLRFHDLRHEATSRLFEKGLSTEQTKAITGHKTYQMLARYTHLKAVDLVSLLG